MSSSFKIGRVLGIPLQIHYSWFAVFLLVTISLALYYFPANYPSWSPPLYWLVGLVTSLLFFASVLVHELAHSVVSISRGIPVKSITLFIFGGVSRISKEATRPSTEFMMAVAGPLSSVALAGGFAGLRFLMEGISQPVAAMAGYLAWINLLLAFFNMIPGFPLDGGRVLRSIIWWLTGNYRRSTHMASLVGRGIGYLFIGGGVFIIFFLYISWVSGLWLAFIGWFLGNAASASYRQVLLVEALKGFSVSDLMTRNHTLVHRSLTLRELVQGYLLYASRPCFLANSEGSIEGMVTLGEVKKVPKARWDTTTGGEVMTPLEKLNVALPAEDVVEVLEKMDEEKVAQMPVVEEGRLLGVIGREDVLHFAQVRSELKL